MTEARTEEPRETTMMDVRQAAVILTALLTGVGAAQAQDCPTPYDNDDCLVLHSSGALRRVCTYNGTSNTYTCHMTNSGGSTSPDLTAVSGYSSNSNDVISVWGTDGYSGQDFCCSYEQTIPDPASYIVINGNSDDDVISLTYGSYNLTGPTFMYDANGNWTGHFQDVEVQGKQGDDEIYGSEDDDVRYDETLIGGRGDDDIWGNAGHDVIWGCGLGKTCSSSDFDELWGNEGYDTLQCDQNACEARGGNGSDIIKGSDDDDTLLGGAGWDRICGMPGADAIFGGGDDDDLWGGSGADSMTGGPGIDSCAAPQGDCEIAASLGCPL